MKSFNPSCAENWILQENNINTLAADTLAPCVTRSSAAMVLSIQDKFVFVFFEEEFEVP